MPTYQYACTDCGHQFEAFQSFSDSALTECPECTGVLRKVYGSVGVVFKGSGFYRTDSRAGNGKSSTGAGRDKTRSESSKSDASKSDSTKSDSSKSDSSKSSDKAPAKSSGDGSGSASKSSAAAAS